MLKGKVKCVKQNDIAFNGLTDGKVYDCEFDELKWWFTLKDDYGVEIEDNTEWPAYAKCEVVE